MKGTALGVGGGGGCVDPPPHAKSTADKARVAITTNLRRVLRVFSSLISISSSLPGVSVVRLFHPALRTSRLLRKRVAVGSTCRSDPHPPTRGRYCIVFVI